MAPRGKRGESSEPQAFHELGVRGRKTGVFLKDTGERDEHGMQPLEDLLSSPQKAPTPAPPINEDSGSEDMELESSVGPGPRTILKGRPSLQFPIPRSRSPVKTNLKSPARKNPHIDRHTSQGSSSPTRSTVAEDRDPTVTRMLEFGYKKGKGKGRANGTNGTIHEDHEHDSDDAELQIQDDIDSMDLLEESLQMVDAVMRSSPPAEVEEESIEEERQEDEEEEEEEDEPPVIQKSLAKRGRGRPPRVVPEEPAEEVSAAEEELEVEEEEQPVRKRGRPAKKDAPKQQPAPVQSSKKRRSLRNSTGEADEEEDVNEEDVEEIAPQAKRQRTKGPAASRPEPVKPARARAEPAPKPEPKPRGRPGRKPKVAVSEDVGETSFAALQRGPPMPKSRGLVSVRRDADVMTQTRSGRHSYKPLSYWRGEQAVMEEEELGDMFTKDRFVLPTIKEVIRVPEEAAPSKSTSRGKGRTKGKTSKRVPVEEEPEEWEVFPGTVNGEVVLWEPEHELHPPADDEPVQIAEEQIAISADAVQTKDIRDATFRFAKTLSMPFMGAGVVDLPPGADKRPKNSRKMHMVFFVHSGKVLVTVNEAQFRITAGGMWFVPRGNYYSITNDYDTDARVFFCQGCEIAAQLPEQSQNSTMAY